jgi:hypothetical protein
MIKIITPLHSTPSNHYWCCFSTNWLATAIDRLDVPHQIFKNQTVFLKNKIKIPHHLLIFHQLTSISATPYSHGYFLPENH